MIAVMNVQCVVDSSDELSEKIELLENAGFSVNLEYEEEDENGKGVEELI